GYHRTCAARRVRPGPARGPPLDRRPGAGAADGLSGPAAAMGDRVDGVEVRQGRRLDDVRRCRAAPIAAGVALDLHLQRHLALRVLALGDAAHDEFAEARLDPGDTLDGLEDRVDRAVADGRV